MERIAPLSKEVVKVRAGRSIVKYEVKEKRGPRLRENAGETWDDWAIERKWSWGRRRDEEEKWSQGRGEISGQGRGGSVGGVERHGAAVGILGHLGEGEEVELGQEEGGGD